MVIWILGVSLCVQGEPDLLRGAADRIARYRTGSMTVRAEADGRPVPGALVTVSQARHEFLFGCGLPAGRRSEVSAERFAALFNYASVPFYWATSEPVRGRPDSAPFRRAAAWCQDRGIRVKGQPVFWHHSIPPWVGEDDPIETLLQRHVKHLVKDAAGLVDHWEVISESLEAANQAGPFAAWVRRRGPAQAAARCLEWSRQANPSGVFLVNESRLDPAYVGQIQALRDLEAPLHAVGLQSHMHEEKWPLERVWELCDRYGKLGLPLHFTEVTVLSGSAAFPLSRCWPPVWNAAPGDEEAQADYVVQLYTLLFSHPAVAAVTWWDLSDDGAWMRAPGGLLRHDMSPKPAYQRLFSKIRGDWWTAHREVRTDEGGQAEIQGFRGTYTGTVRLPDGRSRTFRARIPGESIVLSW